MDPGREKPRSKSGSSLPTFPSVSILRLDLEAFEIVWVRGDVDR